MIRKSQGGGVIRASQFGSGQMRGTVLDPIAEQENRISEASERTDKSQVMANGSIVQMEFSDNIDGGPLNDGDSLEKRATSA